MYIWHVPTMQWTFEQYDQFSRQKSWGAIWQNEGRCLNKNEWLWFKKTATQCNDNVKHGEGTRQTWVKTQWLMDFNFPHFTSIQIMICNEILFCGFPFILFITPLCRDWSLARFEIKSKHIFIIKSIFSQPVTFKISKDVNLSNILFCGKRKIIQFHLLRKDAVAAVYMYTKSIC